MEKFSWDSRVKCRTTCSSETSGSGGGVPAQECRGQVVSRGRQHAGRLGGRAPPGPALVEDQWFAHQAATATPSTPARARR